MSEVKGKLVIQENELILQKGEMSAIEMKLFYAIIRTIDRREKSFSRVVIPVKDIISDWDLNSKHAYGELKGALNALASKNVRREIVNNDGKYTYEVIPYLSYAKYERGIITIEISAQMAPFLLDLKQYTSQCYEQLTKLKGEYALRVYELMKMSSNMKLRIYRIQELRDLLNIGEKYKDNQSFIRNVIESALEEINEKTEILVTMARGGRGEKTTLTFRIESKMQLLKETVPSKDEKTQKHKYGEYKHVLLTDMEYEKLANDLGAQMRDDCICFLDEYIEMKGYKAKNHNLCIRKWVQDAVLKEKRKKGMESDVNLSRRLEKPDAAK